MTSTHTITYTRTKTATYVADKIRGLLSELVRDYGLDPKALHDSWSISVGEAARIWMESGHLNTVTIEFYSPGSSDAKARWDFPIRYNPIGVDDLWVDKSFFRESISKTTAPPAGCIYRVILNHSPGAPDVSGMSSTDYKNVTHLVARDAGTVISTPDIYSTARYYR